MSTSTNQFQINILSLSQSGANTKLNIVHYTNWNFIANAWILLVHASLRIRISHSKMIFIYGCPFCWIFCALVLYEPPLIAHRWYLYSTWILNIFEFNCQLIILLVCAALCQSGYAMFMYARFFVSLVLQSRKFSPNSHLCQFFFFFIHSSVRMRLFHYFCLSVYEIELHAAPNVKNKKQNFITKPAKRNC